MKRGDPDMKVDKGRRNELMPFKAKIMVTSRQEGGKTTGSTGEASS